METSSHMVLQARGWGHLSYRGEDEAIAIQKANLKRAANCVNALAGIRNPAKVTALIEACRTLNMWVETEPKNEKEKQIKFDAIMAWRKATLELAAEMKP